MNETNKTATATRGRDGGGNYIQYAGDIVIPESVDYNGTTYAVTSIGYGAFWNCTGLTSINVDESNTMYSSVDGVLYNKTKTSLLQCPDGKRGVVNIPGSVTEIGGYAFAGCTGLTSIEILWPDIPNIEMPGFVEIGNHAFSGCIGLTSIEIPGLFARIGSSAFSGCTGLKSIKMPSSVDGGGDSTFYGCTGLTTIEIPGGMDIGSSIFQGCTGLTAIELPAGCPQIGRHAFYGCTGLTEVTIGESVWFIGDSAFYDCMGLISLTVKALEPPECEVNTFEGVSKVQCESVVPETSVERYKNAPVWKDFLRVTGKDFPSNNTAVEVPDALKAVRVYAADGHIEVRGLPLGTAVTLSGVDGRLWYQAEAVTGPELTLGAPRGHVYVLRLNRTHSLKVYLP